MKISKQKLKQIIMEEMQDNPLDRKALEIEIGKLNTDFEKWADELQALYGNEEIPMEPNPYDVGEDGELLWKTHSPQEFKSKFHADKDVQEAKKTDCFSRKTFDGKSKCIQDTKGFGEKRANAYVASVLRDMGEIKEDYSKQQKENKTMKISKAELMEIIKEEIMGAMSEEQAVEEAAEEQAIEEALEIPDAQAINAALEVLSVLGPQAAGVSVAGIALQKAFEVVAAYLKRKKAKKEKDMGDK